jgi:hypothetical protein
MSGEYRVNKTTGQVIKDDGTGWKPVASVRNKNTGEILIDEGNGWQPMPGSQRNLTEDRGMRLAGERANTAFRSNQPIAKDDLARLSKPDFSTAAMARLPAPTMTPQQLDAFDAEQAAKSERLRVPDNDTKERSMALLNSVTFGNAPRLAAGAQTLGALAATPFVEGDIIDREGISGATSQFLDENRIHQRRGREERPIESISLEVVPALFQGKTIVDTLGKKLLPQANTAANVARVAGTGGAYGALYGASQDESGTLEGAGEGAAIGGGLGVAGGVALKTLQSPATVALRKSKEAGASIYDALSSALGRAGGARDRVAEDVAIAAVRRSMERSGMSIDQVMDLVQRYEGKPAVLAEVLGQDAINALTALTRRPGSTPQKAQDLIEERFYGRPDRMKADVEEATGIGIGQLDETLSTQLEARQEAAKPIYDALYKRFNTIKSFGESLKRINRIARTPAMQKHLKLAEEAVKTQAALRQVPISKMSKMEYWDLVKRSLDDEINSAVAKGEARTKVGASVADLTQLKKAITDEFDRLTDGAYAAAREAGGEAPRLKAAAAAGQKALQARNPREVARTVAATLAQDLPALRAGMVDDLGTRIDKGMTPGRVRVPDVAGKLRSGLGEESANKLINRFDAEATLSETGARWAPRMNSVTGTVLESGATQMGDDLVNAGINLATGNKVELFRQAINFMRTQGFSQRQIDAIGDLLLSSPEEGLKRLRVMKPDGAPSAAIGAASGGGDLPPPSTPPTPQAAQAASAGPIRAAGFGGFGGGKPLVPKGYVDRLNDTKTIAEAAEVIAGTRFKPAKRMDRVATQDDWTDATEEAADLLRTEARRQGGTEAEIQVAREFAPDSITDPKGKPRLVYEDLAAQILRSKGIDPEPLYGPMKADRLTNAERATNAKLMKQAKGEAIVNDRMAEELGPDVAAGERAKPRTLNGLPLRGDLGNALAGAGIGAAGPADSNEERLRNMAVGAGIGFGARRFGKAFGAQADGAVLKPVPPKAPRTVGKSKLGTRTADAAAVAALASAPPAQADTGGGAELEAANERVATATKTVADTRGKIAKLQSQLEMLQDPKGDISAKQEILKLRGRPLGKTGPKGDGVDGVDGPNTTAAITDEAKKIEAAIAREEAALEKAEAEEADARKGVTQAEMRMAQQEAEVSPMTKALREVAPWAGTAAGIAIAGFSRRGAVAKSRVAAQQAAARANTLLNASTKVSRAQRGPDALSTRAANLNEFWRLGGAGENVPFKKTKDGKWTQRPKPVEPSRLFPAEKFPLRSMDAGVMAGGALEAGGSQLLINDNKQKADKARQDIQRYADKGDLAGVKRAQAELEEAENMVALATAARNLGLMIAGGRGIAALKMPYAQVRPGINMAAAEDEQALLLSKMKK